jgi:transposase
LCATRSSAESRTGAFRYLRKPPRSHPCHCRRIPTSTHRRPIGRPTKLTDEIRDTIVAAIRDGNYSETAAAAAGIGKTTFYLWMVKGETLGGKYEQFREAVHAAEADAEAQALTVLLKAMPEDWRAAAWYLERKFQDRWGRKDRLDLHADGIPAFVVTFGGETT